MRLESMPIQTVITPSLVDFIEQVVESIPVAQRMDTLGVNVGARIFRWEGDE